MAAARRSARVEQILARLDREYPDAECALHHENPLQLLVATILSAQCTDARVNLVTPELFRRYPDAGSFARAGLRDLEGTIRSTGFFRSKARNIRECCRRLVDRHEGRVPSSLDELVRLPGVGRKTANVVLGNAFGIPGITVDTHVGRVARRLGLTRSQDAVKVEFDLMKVLPRERWSVISLQMIWLGRRVCAARRPKCPECFLHELCPFPSAATRPAPGAPGGARASRTSAGRRPVRRSPV